jgi:hypothetical protein
VVREEDYIPLPTILNNIRNWHMTNCFNFVSWLFSSTSTLIPPSAIIIFNIFPPVAFLTSSAKCLMLSELSTSPVFKKYIIYYGSWFRIIYFLLSRFFSFFPLTTIPQFISFLITFIFVFVFVFVPFPSTP